MRRPLLISLLALVAACAPRPQQGEAEDTPQVVLHGARLQSFEGDELVLSGKAARVTYQRIGGDVTASDTVLYMPSRQARGQGPVSPKGGQTEIHAPRLNVSMPARVVTGSGGVVVRTPDGAEARTPSATYDGNEQRVRGSEGVTLRGPDYAVRADGFQATLSDGTYTLEGSVQTVLGAAQ